jgi:two-component system response regulator FixJ
VADVAIVDDDSAVRDSLKLLLELEGLSVNAYASGEEYLRSEDRHNLLLLLDLHMPGVSGIDLLKILQRETTAPPAIVITAVDDPAAHREALRRGAIAVLPKPVDVEILLAEVRKHARSSK